MESSVGHKFFYCTSNPVSVPSSQMTVYGKFEQDWTKPVGYHVTLPCSKDQAGYRTFDAAFAMDRGDGTMEVVMKYMHNMFRDQNSYHSR
jgi:hypothetical protein